MAVDRKAVTKARRKQRGDYKKRKARAIKTLASYKNADGTQKETSIEKKIRLLLDSMGLYYVQEKEFFFKGRKKVFDFYVTTGLMSWALEIQGSYWHSQKYLEGEQKYNTLTGTQKKNLRNDKFKNLMMKELGIPLLYLWEDEINRNILGVKEKIINFLKTSGFEQNSDTEDLI